VAAELGAERSRLAVVDLGGGSCEIALGDRSLAAARSLPLGVLRLRHLSPMDTRAVVQRVAAAAIDDLKSFAAHDVVLSSGTARALLRVARRLGFVPPLARDLPGDTLGGIATLLGSLSPSALGAIGVPEARRDTIATGALVFDTIVRGAGVPRVHVARAALREGVLASMATPPSTRGEEFAAT
jgi:exopolyphosphatase/pppGpp-phosphohydrolase